MLTFETVIILKKRWSHLEYFAREAEIKKLQKRRKSAQTKTVHSMERHTRTTMQNISAY